MEAIIISSLCSLVISLIIGNIVGIHYLSKLDKDWEKVFDELKDTTLEEIKKYMHH